MSLALYLQREQMLAECTLGVLAAGPHKLFTIEPPWVPHRGGRGGVRHASCVAEGRYRIRGHQRPSGERVWLLSNAGLDVFEFPADARGRGDAGRFLVTIQAAEHWWDVVDGIGVGTGRVKTANGWALENSRDAMNRLRTAVGSALDLTLVIGGPNERSSDVHSPAAGDGTDPGGEAAGVLAAARETD